MNVNPQELVTTVKRRWKWLAASTAAFTMVSLAYALLKPDTYNARQPLIVRDEGYGHISKLGEFSSVDAMQTAQETILEVAKHPSVLRAALMDVGPPRKKRADWPSPETVAGFAHAVRVSAPGGAQFGRTEMIYLTVKAESPERAVALASSISDHLIERMKRLRQQKYDSILEELQNTTDLARTELARTTNELKAFESALGSDLAELRMSLNSGQGQSHLRVALTELDADLRRARAHQQAARNEITQLREGQKNPELLITLPNNALDSQPTLRRLKESLVEAQVTTAQLTGQLSHNHPRLQAAMAAEQKLKRQLISELQTAIKSREMELRNIQQKIVSLEKQRDEVDRDLAELSTQHTRYANLLAQLDQRNTFLKDAESDLASARASMLSSAQISLIQKVDQPIPSVHPLGPGKLVILLAGVFAGAMTGIGIIYIFGIEPSHKRRLSDQISYGRRSNDAALASEGKFVNRRGSDPGRRQSDRQPAGNRQGLANESATEKGLLKRPPAAAVIPPLDSSSQPEAPVHNTSITS